MPLSHRLVRNCTALNAGGGHCTEVWNPTVAEVQLHVGTREAGPRSFMRWGEARNCASLAEGKVSQSCFLYYVDAALVGCFTMKTKTFQADLIWPQTRYSVIGCTVKYQKTLFRISKLSKASNSAYYYINFFWQLVICVFELLSLICPYRYVSLSFSSRCWAIWRMSVLRLSWTSKGPHKQPWKLPID